MVQFRLLGPLEAQDGERRVELGRPKQRVLLAVLLVHANHVVSVDRLVEELWGEEPPPQAAASVQTYVSNLRRALEPGRPARAPSRVRSASPRGTGWSSAPGTWMRPVLPPWRKRVTSCCRCTGQRRRPGCCARGWRCGGAGAGRGSR